MSVDEYNEMMNELDMLLNGGITYKNINGKKIRDEDIDLLTKQIQEKNDKIS